MSEPLSKDFLDLIRKHFGLGPGASILGVPRGYIHELNNHISLNPKDTNFRVTLEPNRGFGRVTCLEDGCDNLAIQLKSRPRAPDGGRSEGFGSLWAYRLHVANSRTHVESRNNRLNAEAAVVRRGSGSKAAPALSISVKKEPKSAPQPSRSSLSRPGTTNFASNIYSAPRVKSEPQDAATALSREKRVSNAHIPKSEPGQNTEPVFTRVKAESASLTPFALLDNKMQPAPLASTEDTRSKIADVQTQIAHVQGALDRLRFKPDKTSTDVVRFVKYRKELEDLQEQKTKYNDMIPSIYPLRKPVSQTHTSDNNLVFSASHRLAPVASSSSRTLPPSPFDDYDDDMYRDRSEMASEMSFNERFGDVIPRLPAYPGAEHFNDRGEFYGRGRDLFVGPQAKADDIEKFLLEAGNAEKFDGNESVDRALQKLSLKSQFELIPGMEVALMPHQTIGVAWMVDREQSTFKGGCLADDMGLGKTIQMIALIIKNRSTNPNCKTNLIITPAALLDQWKLEVELKTNCNLRCLIYHGPSKPRRAKDLLQYDIVITTYATMANEWPDYETEKKKRQKERKKSGQGSTVSDSDEDYNEKRKKKFGPLFQVDFYRIVLDEAQSVRNRRTRTSRAVTSLKTEYRWCLTGTPIINSLADAYGYIRFLQIRPWYDLDEFSRDVLRYEKKNPTLAVSRLQAIHGTFLLRRMKDSMLDGKRLIELPEKKINLVKLEFSAEEREIYAMVEVKSQNIFNRYLRAGTVLKNYSHVLILLLRLRQICCHPCLIQEEGSAFVKADEVDNLSPELSTELTRASRLVSPKFVTKLKERFRALALERIAVEKQSVDAVVEDEDCPICYDGLTDAVITPCAHVFCRECLTDVFQAPFCPGDQDEMMAAEERPCPVCRAAISPRKIFLREAFMPSDAELFPDVQAKTEKSDVEIIDVDAIADIESKGEESDIEIADAHAVANTRTGKRKAKPRKARRASRMIIDSASEESTDEQDEDDEYQEDDDEGLSDFIIQSDEDEDEKDATRKLKRLRKRKARDIESDDDEGIIFGAKKRKTKRGPITLEDMTRFLPSTKMKYMMKQLKKTMEERPDEKILVVSQWTGCLWLVSAYLSEEGIMHIKYQGDMSRSKREQAVRIFMAKDKARVMLMSTKCGGVGLNLTRANNVISLDLCWSQAVEAQAYDRVHRLGQTRSVGVQRLVIVDTVEDRILTMQERKQTLADGSLGEGNAKKIGKLSVKELANLFNLDHYGRRLD